MPPNRVNIVRVITNEHAGMFAELIEFLTDCLTQLGITVSMTDNVVSTGALNLFIGHLAFLLPDDYAMVRKSGVRFIIFQAEAMGAQGGFANEFPAYVDFLPAASQLWDYSETNVTYLRARGCADVRYIPLGYCAKLERIAPAPLKDIDVLFYGVPNLRRLHVIDQLHARGVQAHLLCGGYGAERDQLIARSKIVLNIHQFELSQFEQIRISYLLNNRAFVISEMADANPYGNGLVFTNYAELADCCAYFLRPEMASKRDEIANAGFAALKEVATVESIRQAIEDLMNKSD